jgi:hypothetical protein
VNESEEASSAQETSQRDWWQYLKTTGLNGVTTSSGATIGTTNAQMLQALSQNFSASDLTTSEKFNLINLPVLNVQRGTSPIEATLCDICLAVPRVKGVFSNEQVDLIVQIVYQFKRVAV